ncbi:ATP-binding protein [Jiangella aurantiaca]|nr:ATP-binding protein [Jiangella aurantiaca]
MLMSFQEFAGAFPAEGAYIEFKQGVSADRVAEAITAFSNTDGGVLLAGVSDDGVPLGISTDGEMQARIHRLVSTIHDPGRYEIHELLVGDKRVLVIAVSKRREGFTQLRDGRILVRRGAMNTALFGTELSRFVAEHALSRFETTELDVKLADADSELVERLSFAYGWNPENVAERLVDQGLVSGYGDSARLTVAGALYLLRRPADVLGKSYVEVFRYRDISDVYDRRFEIDGPLDQQVARTTTALMDELGSDVVVLGLHRHELPRVPEAVLREAIANAIAHRTYENSRQPVRVEIRPDRIVVRSPGGLPEPVTLANIREQNAARNVHVIKVLRRFRLAEDAGMGVDVMQDSMEAALLEPPEFTADDAHVQVILWLRSTVTARERAWIAEVEQRGHLRKHDRVLLLHAARGVVLTNTSARALLGVDSVHARAALHRLRNQGYLRQTGQRGGAAYLLAKELGPPAGLQLADDELRALVRSMTQEGPVTNEAVRERTGLERDRVLALLTSMVESGEIERHGQRRGTYYTARS